MNEKDLLKEAQSSNPRNLYLFTHKESNTNFFFSDGWNDTTGEFYQDVQIQVLK